MTSKPIQPTPFLRRVLLADAGISATVGALMAAGAGPLQRLTGLPATADPRRTALLPYAAYLVGGDAAHAAARRGLGADRAERDLGRRLRHRRVRRCVCAGRSGMAFLAVQAVTVLAFAELEFIGLRRAQPATRG